MWPRDTYSDSLFRGSLTLVVINEVPSGMVEGGTCQVSTEYSKAQARNFGPDGKCLSYPRVQEQQSFPWKDNECIEDTLRPEFLLRK